ncbi:immunity-related GTPase family M protein 1-like [Orycteropus afer afer]|uniref:Immunity-related GTPase family M protein 1-like n=1 Tax=Orycteropus afer afer TaxID=1230840 RepID=A0A8B7AY16_ORYAF|nr:immunity-related GTPase family M protein 1-like [Orycteropus afer afer]
MEIVPQMKHQVFKVRTLAVPDCFDYRSITVIPLITNIMESPVPPHSSHSASFHTVLSCHTGSSISPEAGAMNFEKGLMEGNILKVISAARETFKTVPSSSLNIAVTGASGNGMSTFINGLRDTKHDEEASAPIGVVRTTQIRVPYSCSCFPNVMLWDLPGMGAVPQSLENYVREMKFNQYDLIIIIVSEHLSMNHVMLAKAIESMGKKFYIVWTKLDRDLSTSVLVEEQLLKTIRDNILKNLQNEQIHEPPIFLVSSLDPLLYDFPKLKQTLQMDLILIRQQGPLQKLFQICEEIINKKVSSLLERIDTQSFQDIFHIQDPDDSEECLKVCKLFFGVDDDSLQQVAQSMGTTATEYKNIMKSKDLQSLSNWDQVISWTDCNTAYYLQSVSSYIPFIGGSINCHLRWVKHRRFLEVVAEDTKNILRKVLSDSIISRAQLS